MKLKKIQKQRNGTETYKTVSMCMNYTRTAILSKYDIHWDPKNLSKLIPNKTFYIQPFSEWIKEDHGNSIEDIKCTYLYKLIKDEYEENIKELYHGQRGCCDSFCQKYRISEDTFDERMVNAVTASISFIGNIAMNIGMSIANTGYFLDMTNTFFGYAEKNCSKAMACGCTSYMHWWFTSWIYKFMTAVCITSTCDGEDIGINSSESRLLYLSELFAEIACIAFEHPEEVPYLFYVARYYMFCPYMTFNTLRLSKANMLFCALSVRTINDETISFKSKEDWLNTVQKDPSFEKLYSFINMPALIISIKQLCQIIDTNDDNVYEMALVACPFYAPTDIYDVLHDNTSFESERIELLKEISKDFSRATYFTDDNLKICKKLSENHNSFDHGLCSKMIWYYIFIVAAMDMMRACQEEKTLVIRDELCTMEHILAKTRRNNHTQKNYKTDAETAQKNLKTAKRQIEKIQTKYESELKSTDALRTELTILKEKLHSREDTADLYAQINELKNKLEKEKSQKSAYKNRIKTLESKQNKEQDLENKIKNLENELNETMHLNKLLMEAPEEDLTELTHEELNILYNIKASLVVPSMNSMLELQKLMPNSEFKFTKNDGKNPTRVPPSCDIFFYCLKFCKHSDYWFWKSQLLNVPKRCVALYTIGKNNIARAIIEKYKELKAEGLIKN